MLFVMRFSRTRVWIAITGAAVTVTALLLWPRQDSGGLLKVKILNYVDRSDFRGAAVIIRMPAGRQMSSDPRPGACFQLETVIDTPAGRRRAPAADSAPITSPWTMEPAATNTLEVVLPLEARRWRLVLSGREAGLRERAAVQLRRAGTWARDTSGRLRPTLLWCLRRLPNNPGHRLEFQSELFEIDGPIGTPLHQTGCSERRDCTRVPNLTS